MKNRKEMRSWLDDFNLNHPLVIAGPCSAETEDQVLKIAHDLKNTDVSIYRAGIWKPRTRPGMFEGVGAIGLKWLDKVKKETGLLTATEVAWLREIGSDLYLMILSFTTNIIAYYLLKTTSIEEIMKTGSRGH